MKLVQWLLLQEEDCAEPQLAQTPPRCTKCNSSPINGQYQSPYAL